MPMTKSFGPSRLLSIAFDIAIIGAFVVLGIADHVAVPKIIVVTTGLAGSALYAETLNRPGLRQVRKEHASLSRDHHRLVIAALEDGKSPENPELIPAAISYARVYSVRLPFHRTRVVLIASFVLLIFSLDGIAMARGRERVIPLSFLLLLLPASAIWFEVRTRRRELGAVALLDAISRASPRG